MSVSQRHLHLTRALLALATVLVAALLMVNCIDIYRMGIAPENLTETGVYIRPIYSREAVSQRLGEMSWAFLLWIAALISTVTAGRFAPKEPPVLPFDASMRLALVRSCVLDNEGMRHQQRFRRVVGAVGALALAVCVCFSLVYLINPAHFASRDLESVMGAMLLGVGPWALGGMAALLITAALLERSRRLEIEAAKSAPRREAAPMPAESRGRALLAARIVLYAAAIALIALGVLNGGMRETLYKAINICTECIGLG